MEYGMNKLAPSTNIGSGLAAGYGEQANNPTTERSSQIQSASICLEAKIEDVQSRVQALEKRLYPILRPCPPIGGEAQKQAVAPVPLAETLQIFGVRLDACANQLNSILERIEL